MAELSMAELRIGTCSWKYPSWEGLVYTASKGINYLQEYASQYSTVEIDQWFWSLFENSSIKLPRNKDVVEYRHSVPASFRFSIKAPNCITLTHYYKKKKANPLIENPYFLSGEVARQFIGCIEPLRDVLGPIILQFEYLNKQKMASQGEFLSCLERFFKNIGTTNLLAVEIRNPYYLNASYFDLLKQFHVSPVLLHGYWMPSVLDVYRKWRKKILAHNRVVVRLHGADRSDIEKQTGKRWNKIVAPMDDELKGIANMITDLRAQDIEVFVNVNNHYEGSAPLTIERLGRLIRSTVV